MYAFIAAGLKAVRAFSSVLDHGQDIGLGAIEKAGREEVARQDRFGLGAQELRSARTCPSRRGPLGKGRDALQQLLRVRDGQD